VFEPRWYRQGPVAALVREYYGLLRSIVRAKPPLRPCLTRCVQCHIFFLTAPSNRGRRDLRCPFGCRAAHRQQQSTRRSVAYYQDEDGKKYRRKQNARRQRWQPGTPPVPPTPAPAARAARTPPHWPAPWLAYLRMVISLWEGRRVSLPEIRALLQKIWKQHPLTFGRPGAYAAEDRNKSPP
jgi:hypothetical protein